MHYDFIGKIYIMPKYVLHTLLCMICLIIMRLIDGNSNTSNTLRVNSLSAHDLSYRNESSREVSKEIIHNNTMEVMAMESAGKKLNGKYSINLKNRTIVGIDARNKPLLRKIHYTLTRSKDAVWATISLTFMCVVLLIAVAQSQMWREHRVTEGHGIPLPNFNERVPFKEVMERKMALLKEMFSRKKKKHKFEETELESLLVDGESE